jgi:hypothetical protein
MQSFGGQVWIITAMCLTVLTISLIALLMSPETRHVDIEK